MRRLPVLQPVPSIKVMADYNCWPLWAADGEVDNIDPASVPLSVGLRRALLDWADAFDAILDHDDPAASGFASPEARVAFDRRGRELAQRVAGELRETHRVLYYSVAQQTVETVRAGRID